jgi:site-specific DNA-methyltransferase (adenine-specific)
VLVHGTGALNIDGCRVPCGDKATFPVGDYGDRGWVSVNHARTGDASPSSRWPANVIHDGSDEVLAAFDLFGSWQSIEDEDGNVIGRKRVAPDRFFYSAKASKADRAGSKHPTVKPLSLMRYLCKLVTPPGGTVLDMFAGSGTTLQAAMEEGFHAIGIEQSAEYVTDICRRIDLARGDMGLFAAE